MAKVIELTKGFVAVVSKEDYRRVNKYKWHVHHSRGTKKKPGQPYARSNIKGKKVYMHRFVTGAEPRQQVDHNNHCTLDNRQCNLTPMTHIENQNRRRKTKCQTR